MTRKSVQGIEAPHHAEVIAILDFGSQYAQLIARRVREAGAFSMLVAPDISLDELNSITPKGFRFPVVPATVNQSAAPRRARPNSPLPPAPGGSPAQQGNHVAQPPSAVFRGPTVLTRRR